MQSDRHEFTCSRQQRQHARDTRRVTKMTENTDRRLHESPEYRQDQLSAALDGMLAPSEQAALDAHLATCEACSRELEELRQVRALLRSVPEPALPRSFLLPLEGELPAPRQPVHATEGQPRTNVTPLRHPTRRATRALRVTRWIGVIAAVLGMALFLGTLLPGVEHPGGAASSVTSRAPQNSLDSTRQSQGAAGSATEMLPSPTRSPSSYDQHANAGTATANAAPPTQLAPSPTAANNSQPPSDSLADMLRNIGIALLIGGAVLALASLLIARLI